MRIANVVLNNFTRDNRVYKIARSLGDDGHEVTVVALLSGDVPEKEVKDGVKVERVGIRSVTLPRGVFFGLIKFIELTWHIVRRYRHYDAWHCNDTEAFAIGIAAKMLRPKLKLVYDCHEYEAERNGKAKLELKMVAFFERLFIHRAKKVITVSPSIAEAYKKRYQLEEVELIRNLPHQRETGKRSNKIRVHFSIPEDEKVFLYQGAFTYNRGLEEALEAFGQMEKIHLVCMGYGILQPMVEEAASAPNIHFLPAVPYHEVLEYTASADVGLLSVKPTCLSYLYCLPNKLFEYIQAGIPVLSNDLPDCRNIIEEFGIGEIVEEYSAKGLKKAVVRMAEVDLTRYTSGLRKAAEKLHWEREEVRLKEIYRSL